MAPKSSKTVMWFYMFNFFITILLCTFSQPNFDQESKYLNHFIFCLFFILGRKHNKRNGNFWYSPLTANMSKLKPKVRGLLFSCQSVRHEMTHIDVSLGTQGDQTAVETLPKINSNLSKSRPINVCPRCELPVRFTGPGYDANAFCMLRSHSPPVLCEMNTSIS